MTLKLKGCDTEFLVASMVLYGEMNQLPLLSVITAPDQGQALFMEPLVDAGPYSLILDANGEVSTPFGLTNWFIQSVSSFAQNPQESGFCLQLAGLPCQHLPMRGYAGDAMPMSSVLQSVSDRFLGLRTVKNTFSANDPVVGSVVSFNETFGQFLMRMAQAANAWLWFEDGGKDVLSLQWQATLQGTASATGVDPIDWIVACVAREHSAAVSTVRTFWPRSTVSRAVVPRSSSSLFTREVTNYLPTAADSHEQTDLSSSPWSADYYLSDNLAHTGAWPGVRISETQVLVGAIHVYDQSGQGEIRRLLGRLVPGIRPDACLSMLSADAAYGVFAVSANSGQSHAGVISVLARLQLAEKASFIGAALGIPLQGLCEKQEAVSTTMIATVCPWDTGKSTTWAAGGIEGSEKQTTHIKVCFDWSEEPVRVPYAYPMSGRDGVVFCPPSAGDRVVVQLERMWPVVAFAAYQSDDVLVPGVLRHDADADTLSAQRGMVVRGGLVFRTADNGDLVIHAAGNLVLRAEKDIFLDGQHLREHGRAKSGIDDATRGH
jgi:hypothetical protein